jgi:hypothetical protein
MLLPQALACDLLFHDPGLKAGAIHNVRLSLKLNSEYSIVIHAFINCPGFSPGI